MKTNQPAATAFRQRVGYTHEGGKAGLVEAVAQLERQVATCLLFEDAFYESGSTIAAGIAASAASVPVEELARIAVKAREDYSLRHVPLFLVSHLEKRRSEAPGLVAATLARVIQRADELTEFLAVHARVNSKKPGELKDFVSAQIKKGLAKAFQKFTPYQLAKYNRDEAIKLRDVLFLCHAKPKDQEQKDAWAKLVAGTLEAPDTWEVALSAGADKKATWERLLAEKKLGAFALIRNLRNMEQANVDRSAVLSALSEAKSRGILPFQFLAAFRHAPAYAQGIETAMLNALSESERLPGSTLLVLDVSGSMDTPMSSKGTLNRIDAATGLAVLLREVSSDLRVFTFSNSLVEVPALRGLGLVSNVLNSQDHSGTYLRQTLLALEKAVPKADRIIVVTDEQSQDGNHKPWIERAYLINVAPYKPGLDTNGGWTRINGFSERVVDFIRYEEAAK